MRTGVQGGAQGAFDHLAAMNFHRWQRSQWASEFGGGEVLRLFDGFSFEEFGGHTGDGQGGLAAERLEAGAIDDFFPIDFGEFEPEAQHIAAIGGADGADGIGVGHFTDVLGVGDGLLEGSFVHELKMPDSERRPTRISIVSYAGGEVSGGGGFPCTTGASRHVVAPAAMMLCRSLIFEIPSHACDHSDC